MTRAFNTRVMNSEKKLKKHGCIQSMSRKGDCWDNAVAQSVFKTVKTGWAYHVDLQDIHHVKREAFEYNVASVP